MGLLAAIQNKIGFLKTLTSFILVMFHVILSYWPLRDKTCSAYVIIIPATTTTPIIPTR